MSGVLTQSVLILLSWLQKSFILVVQEIRIKFVTIVLLLQGFHTHTDADLRIVLSVTALELSSIILSLPDSHLFPLFICSGYSLI
jgi:hypothetical protein